jgi:hypothetical protein
MRSIDKAIVFAFIAPKPSSDGSLTQELALIVFDWRNIPHEAKKTRKGRE